MALPDLTPITKLATFKSTKANRNPVVQVKRIEKTERRHIYKLWLSDGSEFHDAYVACTLKKSKQLEEGSIVRLWKYLRLKVGDTVHRDLVSNYYLPLISIKRGEGNKLCTSFFQILINTLVMETPCALHFCQSINCCARFYKLSGYLGLIKKGSLLFNFWKEQKGFSVWASKFDGNKKVIVSV
nr:hypothetical protein [Tanacetum cinerariifolium]